MIKQILILSLFTCVTLVKCETEWSISLQSQPNEFRTVELSSLGMTTSNYNTISSSINSSLIQPVDYYKSLLNLQFYVVQATAQLSLGNGQSLYAIIYFTTIYSNVHLSIFQIDKTQDEQAQIKKIATSKFDQAFQISIEFVSPNNGIIFLDKDYIMQFFIKNKKITYSDQLPNYASFISALQTNDNIIWFLQYSYRMYLKYITKDTNTIVSVAEIIVQVLPGNNVNVLEIYLGNGNILIWIVNMNNKQSQFQEFSIDAQNQRIIVAQTEIFGEDQVTFTYKWNSFFIQNTYYLIQTFTNQPFIIVLITLQNQSQNLVFSSRKILSIEDSNTFTGLFISEEGDLMTIITPLSVIGISMETLLTIFYIPLSSINPDSQSLKTNSAAQFGDQILICSYDQSDKPLTSFFIIPHIPVLNFYQSTSNQSFQISWSNGVSQLLTVTSILYPLNDPPFTVNKKYLYSSLIGESSGVLAVGFQGQIIGSNLVATGNMNGSNIEQKSLISNLFKVDFWNNLPSGIITINSTVREGVMIISSFISETEIQYSYSFQVFTQASPTEFVEVATFNSTYSYSQMDSSGSFTLYDGNENQTIYFILFGNLTQFIPVPTNCKSSQSLYFSSQPSAQILSTSCDNVVTIYSIDYDSNLEKFFILSRNIDFLAPSLSFQKIELYFTGLLVLTENTSVYGFDAINNIFYGCINVPQEYLSLQSQIYLFKNSFIYGGDSNNFLQFSYNNFEQSDVCPIRSLMLCCGFLFQDTSFLLGIAVHNEDKSKEYLILPGYDSQQNEIFILYMIEQITAQNQLLTTLNFPSSEQYSLFTTSSYIGFYDQNQYTITLYENCFELCIRIEYSISPSYFIDNGMVFLDGTINVTSGGTNIEAISCEQQLFIQRDKSSYNDVLVTNNKLSSISTFFLYPQSEYGSTVTFPDNKAFTSNLFGWDLSSQFSSFYGTVQQRIRYEPQYNSPYTNMIQILPNLAMYATQTSISCGDQDIFTSELNVTISFFLDDSQCSNNSQYYKVLVFALISTEDQNSYLLNTYSINATYFLNNSTITQVIPNSYLWKTNIFQSNTLISLMTDPLMGLVAIIKPNTSRILKVKVLQINESNVSINLDATVPTISIIAVCYDKVLLKTLFVTLQGFIYYFQANLESAVRINLLSDLKLKNIDTSNYFLSQAVQLQNGDILVEFNDSLLYQAALQYESNSAILTQLYIQAELMKFFGIAFINSAKQIVVVCQFNNGVPIFVLFEDSLIKSSLYLGSDNIKYFISTSSSSIFLIMSEFQYNQWSYDIGFLTISDYVTLEVSSVDLPPGFFGNAFQISPKYAPSLPSNTIQFLGNYTKSDPIVISFASLMMPNMLFILFLIGFI